MKKRLFFVLMSLLILESIALENSQLPENQIDLIDIGINKKDRDQINELLNKLLSNEFNLYVQTLNYHWNVIDPYFFAMHAFFKDQYEQVFSIIDRVAERIRALGGYARASLQQFKATSDLTETLEQITTRRMLENLLQSHQSIIREIRVLVDDTQNKYHDSGTSNFLAEILVLHEKLAWMVRSSLEKTK
jgi:starvation-inducible DNA-binding protein